MFEKFNVLGKVNKYRKLQSEVTKQMESIFHEEKKGTAVVLVRGDNRIEKLVIDGVDRKDLRDLINEALKNVKKKSDKKLKSQETEILSLLGL